MLRQSLLLTCEARHDQAVRLDRWLVASAACSAIESDRDWGVADRHAAKPILNVLSKAIVVLIPVWARLLLFNRLLNHQRIVRDDLAELV